MKKLYLSSTLLLLSIISWTAQAQNPFNIPLTLADFELSGPVKSVLEVDVESATDNSLSFDEKGRITRKESLNLRDSTLMVEIYKWGTGGHLSSIQITNYEKNAKEPEYTITGILQYKGNDVVKIDYRESTADGDVPYGSISMRYDDDGNMVERQEDGEGSSSRVMIVNDEAGRPVDVITVRTIERFGPTTAFNSRVTLKYDERGNINYMADHDYESNDITSYVLTSYVYDEAGRKQKTTENRYYNPATDSERMMTTIIDYSYATYGNCNTRGVKFDDKERVEFEVEIEYYSSSL